MLHDVQRTAPPAVVRGDEEGRVMATGTIVKLLTVVEAARELGISRSKLYELLADGELPSVRIGRTRRIAVSALEEFVAAHTDRAPARSSG
jgi:excisionase family DNA binding protein